MPSIGRLPVQLSQRIDRLSKKILHVRIPVKHDQHILHRKDSDMKLNQQNYDSAVKYVDSLFEVYSKLQVLRLDLSYQKEYAQTLTVGDAKQDMQHLLNNRRSKPTLFKDCVGHIWKLESTPDKRPHLHAAFFYDGSKVEKDVHRASRIGAYWKDRITEGRGLHFNCNAKKADYEKCGIGKISHSDEEMRNNLLTEVLPYLTKDDQSIDSVKSGNERSFGKGVAPKRTSKKGRPRE